MREGACKMRHGLGRRQTQDMAIRTRPQPLDMSEVDNEELEDIPEWACETEQQEQQTSHEHDQLQSEQPQQLQQTAVPQPILAHAEPLYVPVPALPTECLPSEKAHQDPGLPAKLIHIVTSNTLRTDVAAIELMIRMPHSVAQIKERISEILAVPKDRLQVVDSRTQQVLTLDSQVPDSLRVQDACVVDPAHYDIMDVVMAGKSNPPSFMYKIKRGWDHTTLLRSLAMVIDKEPDQILLTDPWGRAWKYPDNRQQNTTIILHVLPKLETESNPTPSLPLQGVVLEVLIMALCRQPSLFIQTKHSKVSRRWSSRGKRRLRVGRA